AGGKQHLGLKDEAVTDDADIVAVGNDLAQPTEEIGPVAVEFLHPPRQRDVEAASEIGDLRLRLLVLLLRSAERVFECGDLSAQRTDLLVQQFHLAERPLADLALTLQRSLQGIYLGL